MFCKFVRKTEDSDFICMPVSKTTEFQGYHWYPRIFEPDTQAQYLSLWLKAVFDASSITPYMSTALNAKGPFYLHVFTLIPARLSNYTYRKTSSISRTKYQNLNVSCFLLQWSLPNPLKPGVKLRMKM